MYGIVYQTTNKITGKKYIGQHKCKTEKDSYLGSGKILKRAIAKYGRENFVRETLYKAETPEELDKKEIEFISKYAATSSDDYYNVAEGGLTSRIMRGKNNPSYGKTGSLNPVYGRKHTEDERRRISESQKGKTVIVTEETKKKISETMRNKGIKPTSQAYEKLKGKPGYAHAGRKHCHILCVELGLVFESQSEIERQLGIPQPNIYKVLKGLRPKAGGYTFERTEKEVGPYDNKNGSNQ